jgi:UDP-glucose 4-epimerase
MTLEEAVELVLFAMEHGKNGDILVQKAPACTLRTQMEAVCDLFGADVVDCRTIGIRHGEKMYETLLTNEECASAQDMGRFFRVPSDTRSLNYNKYFTDGDVGRNLLSEFNSNNTEMLSIDEVKEKLLSIDYVRDELAKAGGA